MIEKSEVLREPARAMPIPMCKIKDRGKNIYQNFDPLYAQELLDTGDWEIFEPTTRVSPKVADATEKNLNAIAATQSKEADARQTAIIAAIESLSQDDFTKERPGMPSKPKIGAINAAVGFEITAMERDIAYKLMESAG